MSAGVSDSELVAAGLRGNRVAFGVLAARPSAERETAFMHYVEGLSCEEAAAACGQSAGTVRVRLHRARRRLRERLREFAPVTVQQKEEPRMIEMEVDDVVTRVVEDDP